MGDNHIDLDDDFENGNTDGMKVAVSIPDPIFAEAEALAKQFGTSRSDLYRRALGEFISRHAADPITRAMNEVVDAVGAETDEFSAEAARQALKHVEW
ncbi:MAG TPA: ribbon-helix-helix domain-containing protein [Roseiarcus sp.]|jgi:metal-responsive CopG/Arc/MetJ family transcriptional regulator